MRTDCGSKDIQLSADELQRRRISPSNLALAASLLTCRGYVVLKNALHPDYVDALRRDVLGTWDDCCESDALGETPPDMHVAPKYRVSNRKGATFWHRKSRWRVFPRLVGPLADPQLAANPFVVAILEAMLGQSFCCKFISAETSVRGSMLQSPHSDILNGDTYQDNRWRPRGYILTVPVMKCGLHNGPLEIWPGGSHLWADDMLLKLGLKPYVQDGRNSAVERVAGYMHSVKLELSPGEIMIRDLAMWHRGNPNPTDEPRTLMTMGYFRQGYQYGYGDPAFNVDRTIFRQLDPSVQRLFRYHFTLANTVRRQTEGVRGAVREATAWIKASLEAA